MPTCWGPGTRSPKVGPTPPRPDLEGDGLEPIMPDKVSEDLGRGQGYWKGPKEGETAGESNGYAPRRGGGLRGSLEEARETQARVGLAGGAARRAQAVRRGGVWEGCEGEGVPKGGKGTSEGREEQAWKGERRGAAELRAGGRRAR